MLPNLLAENCWSIILRIGDDLGIRYLLHILEICLVALLSNAESERVFSLLRHIFSKYTLEITLKHCTLEIILHVGLHNDQNKERYGDAVEMFLKEYPDGTSREKKRHLQGHVYLPNRASLQKHCHDAAASALLNVSSDKELKEQINASENVPLECISV